MMSVFFSSRRRHTRLTCDWSSDVCSSDLAKSRQTSSCSEERMFTAKAPLLRMRGHDEEVVAGQNRMSGGSRDTDENDWQRSEERRVGKKRRARGWTKH